ncbi:TPA: integrase, partial [Legionella pneumophila]|nr:integrase [Legionella pneumophila]
NHKMNNDVAAYIMKDVERLRKPMRQVANFILEHMRKTADIKLIKKI